MCAIVRHGFVASRRGADKRGGEEVARARDEQMPPRRCGKTANRESERQIWKKPTCSILFGRANHWQFPMVQKLNSVRRRRRGNSTSNTHTPTSTTFARGTPCRYYQFHFSYPSHQNYSKKITAFVFPFIFTNFAGPNSFSRPRRAHFLFAAPFHLRFSFRRINLCLSQSSRLFVQLIIR